MKRFWMQPNLPAKWYGFTLIELLIVVAIIAILAAIAIPNFLEAQTRAKVSRVKSDMRTTGTALESYYIDNNKYPPTYHAGFGSITDVEAIATLPPDEGYIGGEAYDYIDVCGRVLTSPVAYLASISKPSPFQVRSGDFNHRGFFFLTIISRPDPASYEVWYGFNEDWGNRNNRWGLMDGGPDRSWFSWRTVGGQVIYEVTLPYDPTNGTISGGNIWRTDGRN